MIRSLSVAAAATAAFILGACAQQAAENPQDRLPAHASENYNFDSLPEMTATTETVVVGEVVSVLPGRVVGDLTAPVRFHKVRIEVERYLYGELPHATIELEEDDLGLFPASRVGDYGVFFLVEKRDVAGFYRLVNSEGRFLVRQGGLVASNATDGWAQEVQTWSLDELVAAVEQAAEDAESGEVAPASPYAPCCESPQSPEPPVGGGGAGK